MTGFSGCRGHMVKDGKKKKLFDIQDDDDGGTLYITLVYVW